MTSKQTFDHFINSPWVRVISILVAVFVSLLSWTFLSARNDLREADVLHTEKIDSIEEDVDQLSVNQAVILNELKYIHEGIDKLNEKLDNE